MPDTEKVLVVAHQTATQPGLLTAIRERAKRGPATFHLMVPLQPDDPDNPTGWAIHSRYS